MAAAKVRCHHGDMRKISSTLNQQADAVEKILKNVKSKYQPLADGAWIGEGSRQYVKEQEDFTHPTLERLQKALASGAKTNNDVSKTFEDADRDAAQALNPSAFGGVFAAIAGLLGG